jgi:hypothetical protein
MEQRFKELFEDLEERHRNRKNQMMEETRDYFEESQNEEQERKLGSGRYLTFK